MSFPHSISFNLSNTIILSDKSHHYFTRNVSFNDRLHSPRG